MIFRLLRFFFGYYKIKVPKENLREVLDFFISSGCVFTASAKVGKRGKSESADYEILQRDYESLVAFAREKGFSVGVLAHRGIPALWGRYRKRTGLFFGFAAFIFLLWLSTLYVWDIRVTGNTSLQKEVIIERLGEMGLGVGAKIRDVDYYMLCNDFVMNYDDVIWISVNVQGTVCCVEVRERLGGSDYISHTPSNLVSTYAGQIESLEVYDGYAAVSVGDAVGVGQLLVSGVTETKNGTTLFKRARGHVFAKTTHVFCIDVPLTYETKEYTGAVKKRYSLDFFGRTLKLYFGNGLNEGSYDTIEERNKLSVGNAVELPCYLVTTARKEYALCTKKRSANEALSEAYRELYIKLEESFADCEILERVITEEITDDGIRLICEVYCIMDIAKEIPIVKNTD